MLWLTSQADWLSQPGLWLLGSILVGTAGAVGGWILLQGDRSGRLRRAAQSAVGLTLAWLVRVSWLVLPGYGALLVGAISPNLMGLTHVDWGAPFGYGLLFTLLGWGILLGGGLAFRHQAAAAGPLPAFSVIVASSIRQVVEAGALQWHWAFYRAAAIGAAAAVEASDPIRAGAWAGLVLVTLEAALNPFLWRDLRTPGRGERRVLAAILLVASTILYLISRNFWLAWAFHALPTVLLEPRFATGHAAPDDHNEPADNQKRPSAARKATDGPAMGSRPGSHLLDDEVEYDQED